MRLFILILSFLAITACALPNGQPSAVADTSVKLATLRLIEKSDWVTKDGVLNRVELARKLVESDGITLGAITEKVRQSISWNDLESSERLLVDALIADIEYAVPVEVGNPLTEEQKTRLLYVLGLIEQGASYAD